MTGSLHPATRIMFLYCHMRGEDIIQLPGYCHMRGEVIIQLPGYCHMTEEVIIQLPECFYTDI
jgi:thioredoxin-related protein